MVERYPQVTVDLKKLKDNVTYVTESCKKFGITITGVVKGVTSNPTIAKVFIENGCKYLASSRLEQIEKLINSGIKAPMMMIRIPMLSEVPDVIRLTDYSLNSENVVIEALNREAERNHKIHNVILMADVGDLREGYIDKDELIDEAIHIENDLKSLHLAGIGMNVGCYGSVVATRDKVKELSDLAKIIEDKIGRKLEIVSGGATSSLMRILDKDMPEGINHLRIGEGILLARDLDVFYGYDVKPLNQDAFKLRAEVIEVKNKPTHPIGTLGVDAFGHTPTYIDRGRRKRALLGIGKADYGSSVDELIILEEGMELIGASSDHTIIDVEDLKRDLKVGDIVEFGINYATLIYLTNSDNVNIKFI